MIGTFSKVFQAFSLSTNVLNNALGETGFGGSVAIGKSYNKKLIQYLFYKLYFCEQSCSSEPSLWVEPSRLLISAAAGFVGASP